MPGHGSKLGIKEEEAIDALVTYSSIPDAAQVVGISSRTLFRWLQVPGFKAAYLQTRREVCLQGCARLQQSYGAAVTTLQEIMSDPAAPAASRVRAAGLILEHAIKSVELEDLELRVGELERAAEWWQSQEDESNWWRNPPVEFGNELSTQPAKQQESQATTKDKDENPA